MSGSLEPEGQERAYLRLRQLYEISKLLTSFGSIEGTMTAIVGFVAPALALRSAIFILEGRRSLVWRSASESDERLRAAKTQARDSYAYLVPSEVDLDGAEAGTLPLSGAEGASRFILLPLVIERRPIFGALQFETAAALDEADLMFVNAAVNQLAVALDRQAAIEAKQANAEAKAARAELREVRTEAELTWLRAVLDRMPAGVLIGEAPGGKMILANRQAEQIWGHGFPVGSAGDGGRRGFHPEGGRPYAPEEWPLARSIARGEIVHDEEIDYFRSDGTRGTLLVSSAPIESSEGGIESGVAIFHDITERKQTAKAQRILAEASGILGSSLDYRRNIAAVARLTVPLFGELCVIDEVEEGGEIRRLEVAVADAKQQELAERMRLLVPARGSQAPQAKVLESGEPIFVAELTDPELEVLRIAGLKSMIVVPIPARGLRLGALTLAKSAAYSPMELEFALEIARRIAFAIDSARLYQNAQRASRIRDDLIAIVSHDLRTPLATITGIAELLARSDAPAEKRGKLIETLARSADWMKRLIEDLLDVARIEAGGFAIQEQPCPAGPLLDEALLLMQPLAQQKAIRLEGHAPGLDADLPCDRPRVLQVLSNLIGNAIKFTPAGGAIVVSAECLDREVRFAVKDSGSGIAADELPHVFERFWQSRRARTGAGLGLAIAKGVVEAHRGRIWAESEPGKGSTFFFTLPLGRRA